MDVSQEHARRLLLDLVAELERQGDPYPERAAVQQFLVVLEEDADASE